MRYNLAGNWGKHFLKFVLNCCVTGPELMRAIQDLRTSFIQLVRSNLGPETQQFRTNLKKMFTIVNS